MLWYLVPFYTFFSNLILQKPICFLPRRGYSGLVGPRHTIVLPQGKVTKELKYRILH